MEMTDTMLHPITGFICANCGSSHIGVSVGDRDGRLIVIVRCQECDNELEFSNGNRSN